MVLRDVPEVDGYRMAAEPNNRIEKIQLSPRSTSAAPCACDITRYIRNENGNFVAVFGTCERANSWQMERARGGQRGENSADLIMRAIVVVTAYRRIAVNCVPENDEWRASAKKRVQSKLEWLFHYMRPLINDTQSNYDFF